ncbi:Lrp/AsnC family leucine-responsive transcriptional regulator [Natronocella acetinitrilica]|uniref:Lrp/AsnC family leucine-responsive transcriptional regulator n=1 Tax=Natronocella acetinitrilica TaxID=414046 RepID=A0AAE3G317_9GAMM|nr:Lrp/AsnC family transcriptional regulator [Natronocella acetinitrilica]MCP1674905.1 Lrp/AsnC family leucine-responsive transcriptional regulator [Natronocella acetinitrilica]
MKDSVKLDATDRKIIAALQRDGRLTNAQLAEEVGLSPTPVWRRVRRLEEQGVIRGYTAIIDRASLGMTETVFVDVTIKGHSEAVQQAFAEAVLQIPEVLTAHFVSGGSDFLLRVATGGTSEYHDLLINKLYGLPGVHDVRSSFALKTIKDDGRLSL